MAHPVVVFGGPSPEHDISVLTGLQAVRSLGDAEAVYWSKAGGWFAVATSLEAVDFSDGVPAKAKELSFVAEPGGGLMYRRRPLDISVVVNCCHGGPGEDGTLQGSFDLAGLRYTGPGVLGSALGMDKLAFGAVAAAAGLPSLPRLLASETSAPPLFPPPYIVKPRFGGSSIGIEVASDWGTVLALRKSSPHLVDGAVVEPFLEGSLDLQVAVRTYPSLELSAIEAPERAAGIGIYSYAQKYLAWGGGTAARRLPADVSLAIANRIGEISARVVDMIGLRSLARIDFLCRDDELFLNEVNTIPGSLATYLWIDPPRTRQQLLSDLVSEVLSQPPRRFSTAGSDGTALRNATSIANKLG